MALASRRIVARIPIFGDSFASEDVVLREFQRWDDEDVEEADLEMQEKNAHKRVRSRGRSIPL